MRHTGHLIALSAHSAQTQRWPHGMITCVDVPSSPIAVQATQDERVRFDVTPGEGGPCATSFGSFGLSGITLDSCATMAVTDTSALATLLPRVRPPRPPRPLRLTPRSPIARGSGDSTSAGAHCGSVLRAGNTHAAASPTEGPSTGGAHSDDDDGGTRKGSTVATAGAAGANVIAANAALEISSSGGSGGGSGGITSPGTPGSGGIASCGDGGIVAST
eukprot:4407720-Prymnesium_polylepis.2